MRETFPLAAGTEDQCAGLRAHSARKKRETVDRLAAAIKAIRKRGDPVTGFTIKRECGLDATTIKRNNDAYQLFVRESDYLRAKQQKEDEARQRRRRRRPHVGVPDTASLSDALPSHDPLHDYSKAKLVSMVHGLQADLRIAQVERDEACAKHVRLVQEHAQCTITIMALKHKWLRGRES
jgi:hypothetical protein